MSLSSINGRLKPASGDPAFLAYYVVVSYDQQIGSYTTFQSQTIICEDNGDFRFFIPIGDIVGNVVLVEVHAPNGTLMYRSYHTTGSMYPSSKDENEVDDTKRFKIKIDILEVSTDNFLTPANRMRGKVIDVLGNKIPSNLQVIIWVTNDTNASTFSTDTYQPILVDWTDGRGYFGDQYPPGTFEFAFATIDDAIDQPIPITLDSGALPNNVILPLEFAQEDGSDCGCGDSSVARLPNQTDLTAPDGNFSNDAGGTCNASFKPNRTLEEFDFCSIVRTTEPQIRRHTITEAELFKAKRRLKYITRDMKHTLQLMNTHISKASVNADMLEAFSNQERDAVIINPSVTVSTDVKRKES